MKRNSILLLVAVFLTSCGQFIGQDKGAPKTKAQTGLITSCSTEKQAKSIFASHGIRYRIINKKRNLIEYKTKDKVILKSLLPNSKFKENVIYQNLIPKSFSTSAQSVSNTQFFGAHIRVERNGSNFQNFSYLQQINADSPLANFHGEDVLGQGIKIAVIDTGVYYNHPHLSPNILTNPADPHGNQANGQDEDNNDKADDYVGWDFVNADAYPIDDNGHGTHVAGLAAGTVNGVAPKAKILPIKVLNANGAGDLASITAGILYAIDRGVDIINLSLGGSGDAKASKEIKDLINSVEKANDRDTMIVSAAGNGGGDGFGDCNDDDPMYPAVINTNTSIAVGAVDGNDELTEYSNFGTTVHIAAPGGDMNTGALLSTAIPNCFGPCTENDTPYIQNLGTSMATPIVSGVVALLKSANTNLEMKDIKKIILKNGTYYKDLKRKIKSGMVVNAADSISRALNF